MANDYQHKDGSGAIFKNTRKDKPSQPDYRGDFMLNGITYEAACWIKDGKHGKFMSLSVKAKEDRPQQTRQQAAPPADDFEDDLAF